MPAVSNNVQNVGGGSASSLVEQMKEQQSKMMEYQVEMNTTTALLQAESTAVNQMARALNSAVQNIRA